MYITISIYLNSIYLSEEYIQDLYNHMIKDYNPELLDQSIYNMLNFNCFTKEQIIKCIKYNYPNKGDEFIENKYNDIFVEKYHIALI